MTSNPIGIFDSGIGGLSICKKIHALLFNENMIYLADSKNAPYGEKSKDEIMQLSIKNTEYLLQKGCKLIVVACNTATTNAIDMLRATYEVPFIGIEPAIKPAALNTKSKVVGILATKGTLSSALFHETTNLYAIGIQVIEQVGEGLVSLIENGKLHSEEMTSLLKTYLEPMIAANIDHLVLGCTHYPFLIPQLLRLLPDHVKIVDSGEAIARQTQSVLKQYDLLNTNLERPDMQFITNGNTNVMLEFLKEGKKVVYIDF